MANKDYKILYTQRLPEMKGLWGGSVWQQPQSLKVDCFRPEGSDHQPRTSCKLLYDEQNIFGIFRVDDQYVRCVHTQFQSDVWKDSCVEFFLQPAGHRGYFNFEFNCGGALLCSYVTDSTRIGDSLKEYIPLDLSENKIIERHASLPQIVEPEITKRVVWSLEFTLPFAVLKRYTGLPRPMKGSIWRANFFKCGNETSHPHWASWQPLSARNFHEPSSFGQIVFF